MSFRLSVDSLRRIKMECEMIKYMSENDDLENDWTFLLKFLRMDLKLLWVHNFLSQMDRRAKKSLYDKTMWRNKEHLVFTSLGNLNNISL